MWHCMAVGIIVLATARGAPLDQVAPIHSALDDWHKAAAEAAEERYFGHFAADAVFLGTDATERWTRDEFRKWAKPYFARGTAWTFTPKDRRINLAKDGQTAWFDELLDNTKMGLCRGSGVLVREGTVWKIAQYNLSIPIPNDALPAVKKVIDATPKPGKP